MGISVLTVVSLWLLEPFPLSPRILLWKVRITAVSMTTSCGRHRWVVKCLRLRFCHFISFSQVETPHETKEV